MRVVGIVRNHRALATAEAFASAVAELGENACVLEAGELRWEGRALGGAAPKRLAVTHVAPPLLYGEPAAALALAQAAEHGVVMLNPLEASATADDKARSALRLAEFEVSQPRTVILEPNEVANRKWEALRDLKWPVVAKRPTGSLGMWVHLCRTIGELEEAAAILTREGPTRLVVQEAVTESLGRATRVLVLAGESILATERVAPLGEWRSNVAQGATQHVVELSGEEESVAAAAAAACGLGWAGVDLARTNSGPLVLEVNAAPGFTSMQPHCNWSIAGRVLSELLAR